jgi:hypothetical protein
VVSRNKSPAPKARPQKKQAPAVEKPRPGMPGLTPWTVFQTALKAFPPLKYALAVLGIVSAIAIIKSFGIDFRCAAYGTVVMMVLMVGLLVFAALTKVKNPQVQNAAVVMMWSLLMLTILSATLLFTSAFFDWPKPLPNLLGLEPKPAAQNGKPVSGRWGVLGPPETSKTPFQDPRK